MKAFTSCFLSFALMPFLVSDAMGGDLPYAVSKDKQGVTITCLKDECRIGNIIIDRKKRKGTASIEMSYDVELENFGPKTKAQETGSHFRTMDLNLKDGCLYRLYCTRPAMDIALQGLAGLDLGKFCDEKYNRELLLKFSNKILIRVSNVLEVAIENEDEGEGYLFKFNPD